MTTVTAQYTLVRHFDAPADLVFRAWTEPEQFARWFGPRALTTPLSMISMDLRPGGRWQAAVVTPDGTAHPLGGEYLEVARPHRLVFTTGDPANTDGAPASVATVELETEDGGTQMRFHQAGVNTDEAHAEQARAGWIEFFDRLAEHLA